MARSTFFCIACLVPVLLGVANGTDPRAMYYFTQWSHWARSFCGSEFKKPGQYKGITHISYAFQAPFLSSGCKVDTLDPENDYVKTACDPQCGSKGLVDCAVTVAHDLGIKAGLSLGGWTLSTDFSVCTKDPKYRAALADSIAERISKDGWDYIEFDWEYPYGGGNDDKGGVMHGLPNDWDYYKSFFEETRAALNAKGLTHVEMGGTFGMNPKLLLGEAPYTMATPMEWICQSHDYVGLMSYDLNGGWNRTTGWPSPVHFDSADPNKDAERVNVEWQLNTWQKYCGSYFNKVVLGLPSYGKGWRSVQPGPEGSGLYQQCTYKGPGPASFPDMPCLGDGSIEFGTIELWDVEVVYKFDQNCKHYYHTIAKQDFFYCPGVGYDFPDNFFAYDGPEVMYEKVKLVKAMGGGGFMVWESAYAEITGNGLQSSPAVNAKKKGMIAANRPKLPYGDYVWKPYEDAIWAAWNGESIEDHRSQGIRYPDGAPSVSTAAPTSSVSTAAPTSSVSTGGHATTDIGRRRVFMYIDNNQKSVNIIDHLKIMADGGVTDILMAFFYKQTEADALRKFTQEHTAMERAACLNYLHDRGTKLWISVGGASEKPYDTYEAGDYATRSAKVVIDYDLDGLDFDLELLEHGFGASNVYMWIKTCTLKARQMLDATGKGHVEISHAPQAAYFSTSFSLDGGYVRLMQELGDAVDHYLVQYYNQGTSCPYITYESVAISADCWLRDTSWTSIKNRLDTNQKNLMDKIVIGKPVHLKDASAYGYWDPSATAQNICRMESELGYKGGIMGWAYRVPEIDPTAEYLRTVTGDMCDYTPTTTTTADPSTYSCWGPDAGEWWPSAGCRDPNHCRDLSAEAEDKASCLALAGQGRDKFVYWTSSQEECYELLKADLEEVGVMCK